MTGVARAMFVPLALAVDFSMIFSYLLAGTLVPIMEVWLNQKRRTVALLRNPASGSTVFAPASGLFPGA